MKGQKQLLGFSQDWLIENKSIFTASEICGQPQLWLDTWQNLFEVRNELSVFLEKVFSETDLDIILTGAGTSAFIGETLESYFKKYTSKCTRAVHTTDLVSFPEDYLYKEKSTLLISFARSGNSPESIAAVEIADQICNKVYHLIITCNKNGKLASQELKGNTFTYVLPEESNDKSLAMTGSYTSMMLTGILIARLPEIQKLKLNVEILSAAAAQILKNDAPKIKKVASLNFTRAIFLGSGPLLGVAREAHLKVQELSDGKVVGKHDSCLGFRHGPKAVIDKNSLLVYHFANNEYAHKYEYDLVKEIYERKDGMFRMGIGKGGDTNDFLDLLIELPGTEMMDETMISICSVLPAQILGFYKSIQVGLSPDEPSISGNISRVVKGVSIYPYDINVESL